MGQATSNFCLSSLGSCSLHVAQSACPIAMGQQQEEGAQAGHSLPLPF